MPDGGSVAGERALEVAAPAEEAAHDGADRDVEDVGDLPVGEVVYVGEDDHHAEVDRDGVDRLEDLRGDEPVQQRPLGVLRAVGRVGRVELVGDLSRSGPSTRLRSRVARRYLLMKVLVRIRKSHALRLVPGWKRSRKRQARRKESWTRSSASRGSRVKRRAEA